MNRRLFVLILLITSAQTSPAQSNQFLDQTFSGLHRHGISLSLQLYADALAGSRPNPTTPDATSFQYFDLSVDLDLARLSSHLSGTRAFTSVHVNGSYAADFGGAQQSLVGIFSTPRVRLAEVWIEHSLTKSAQLRLGKIDANPDFALIEIATGFLNAAFGYDPTFLPCLTTAIPAGEANSSSIADTSGPTSPPSHPATERAPYCWKNSMPTGSRPTGKDASPSAPGSAPEKHPRLQA